jgi:uncharacterized protein (DUF433 family)
MDAVRTYDKDMIKRYGADPREIPLYGISQASRYLNIPLATLRSWIRGRKYPVGGGNERKLFRPVIHLPDPKTPMLSFINLVEAHVLSGVRRIEGVPFYKVRMALEYIEKKFPSKHPLADQQFQTDGVDLFIERLGQLEAVSKGGQIGIKEVLEQYLRRIDRDPALAPFRLYPFLKVKPESDAPKHVMIDPLISFGRPSLVGTGVPTDVIAERFFAGESMNDLAKDYGVTEKQVEEAIRYEAPAGKAA